MSSITFTAHGRCARATVCEPITTGSVGLSVSFAFDAAWSGLQKTAIFRGSGMAVDLVLSGDAATVPPEVLTIPGGDLRVGVWGADPDGNVIIPTVWATVGEIVPGAAPSGFDPDPPTPSWAAQVQEIAQDALDTANSVREDADAGAFDGATYTPAVSAGGDLSWTNDKGKPNPPTVNIKGPEGQPGQTGATPDISIGTVETLPPGSPATATMTGTAENPVLSFGIPQGQQGAPGEVTQAEFDALADEVTQQKSAIDDLTDLTNRKAGMLVDSVSGAVVSFVPDATVPNLLGLSVALEPIQDLHGYDSPWPGGGGKNKLPSSNSISSPSSLTVTNENGQYVLNGSVASGDSIYFRYDTITIENGFVFACGNSFVNAILYFLNGTTQVDYFTLSPVNRVINASQMSTLYGKPFGSIRIRFSEDQTFTNAIFSPMVVIDGADTTTFAPFSNLCPISGWDSVEVERTGVNVFDKTKPLTAGLINASGEVVENASYQHSEYYTKLNPSTAYKFSGGIVTLGTYNSIAFYDKDKNFISRFVPSEGGVGAIFTTPSNCNYIRFNTSNSSNINLDTIQLEPGSTAHSYHPFAGNRYTITLGQTVYGGTLTIAEDGSVNALADRAKVDLGSLNWTTAPSGRHNSNLPADIKIVPNHQSMNALCSNYVVVIGNSIATTDMSIGMVNGNAIQINDSTLNGIDASEFKAAMSGVQLCYELGTPITIQLAPVTISTISGQTNNVWTDAGDVAVEFAADLKHYIDSKIAAAVAAMS